MIRQIKEKMTKTNKKKEKQRKKNEIEYEL